MEEKKHRFTPSDYRFMGGCVLALGVLVILLAPILADGYWGWRESRSEYLGNPHQLFYLACALSFQITGAVICRIGWAVRGKGAG